MDKGAPIETFLADLCERTAPLAIPGDGFACNPSIAVAGRGYAAVVRTVNYRVLPSEHLHITPEGAAAVSTSWWVTLDHRLRVTSRRAINDGEFLSRIGALTLEDLRLFRWRNRWWASAAAVRRDQDDQYGTRMVMVRLQDGAVIDGFELPALSDQPCEKNWLLRPGQQLELTPWAVPLNLHTVEDQALKPVARGPGDAGLDGWRGSTTLEPFSGGRLAVVHQRLRSDAGPDFLHRFVLFADDWSVSALSEPLQIQGRGIEFVSGLAVRGGQVILGYGLGDASAHLMVLKRKRVLELLKSPRA